MMIKICFLFIATLAIEYTCAKTIEVHNTNELQNALKSVAQGDTIQMHAGTYEGQFQIQHKSGPVTLKGDSSVKLTAKGAGYCLHLEGVSHWTLHGFVMHNCKKGLVLDGSSNNLLEELEVFDIHEEGIHFRAGSSDNILTKSKIHTTGTQTPGFGEGIYIGSAIKNWPNGQPDQTLRTKIINNHIGPDVRAESIDIKEGSCCGLISGNYFDGHGMSGEHFADSWIDLKGDNYTIENNSGKSSLGAGIEIHNVHDSSSHLVKIHMLSGCHNTIKNNKCEEIHGKCVNVAIKDSTVIHSHDCPNTVENN